MSTEFFGGRRGGKTARMKLLSEITCISGKRGSGRTTKLISLLKQFNNPIGPERAYLAVISDQMRRYLIMKDPSLREYVITHKQVDDPGAPIGRIIIIDDFDIYSLTHSHPVNDSVMAYSIVGKS